MAYNRRIGNSKGTTCCKASAVVRYQLHPQLDINNLSFAFIFIISNSIQLRFGQTIFKYPAIINGLSLVAVVKTNTTSKQISKGQQLCQRHQA